MRTQYSDLIKVVSAPFSLDPDLVEAVVMTESSGNTHAYRFEPLFWGRYLANQAFWKVQIPTRVSASYGLMQVMYVSTYEDGFRGEPEELFIPTVGLNWGCKHLANLFAWSKGDVNSALAAYNGGKGDNEVGHKPMLRNLFYAKKVLSNKEKLT